MVNPVQIILIIVVVTLSFLMVVVGTQVVLVIIDIRKALKRLNNILEDSILGGGLIRPDKLTGVIELIKGKRKNINKQYGSVDEDKVIDSDDESQQN